MVSAPPLGRFESQRLRRLRAAPSPGPPQDQSRNYDTSDDLYAHSQVLYCPGALYDCYMTNEIRYSDLALALNSSENSINISNVSPGGSSTPSMTVYKTVDFVKTEAFNRIREKVEQERKGKSKNRVL